MENRILVWININSTYNITNNNGSKRPSDVEGIKTPIKGPQPQKDSIRTKVRLAQLNKKKYNQQVIGKFFQLSSSSTSNSDITSKKSPIQTRSSSSKADKNRKPLKIVSIF